jgi:hypothetical protein
VGIEAFHEEWMALLQTVPRPDETLWQTNLDLPDDPDAILTFWYQIRSSDEICVATVKEEPDQLLVFLDETLVDTLELCAETSTNSWQMATALLSRIAGQEAVIRFVIRSNENDQVSSVYLDLVDIHLGSGK